MGRVLGQSRMDELKAARREATGALAGHRKICAECHRGEVPALDYCDEGWQMAKDIAAAAAALETYREQLAGEYGGLF